MAEFSKERRIKIVLEYRLRSNSEAGLDKAEEAIRNNCTGEKQWLGLRSFPTGINGECSSRCQSNCLHEKFEGLGYVEDYWPERSLTLTVDTDNGPEITKAPCWKQIQEAMQRAPEKAETLTLQKGRTSLLISGVSFIAEKSRLCELRIKCFTVGADCSHGWRNLINDEFRGEGPGNLIGPVVIGGQRAHYPASSFATLDTTISIVKAFIKTGELDPGVRWDNPPKE